jgi:hypothetical protein
MRHPDLRRPYLSKNVLAGLESILARSRPMTTDEVQAVNWLAATIAFRVSSRAMVSHDASVSPSKRGRGARSPRPSDGSLA